MKQAQSSKKRILVTYGYHLKELFARQVGVEFKRLNLEDIIVRRLKGEKPPIRNYNDPDWIIKEWDQSYKDWRKGKIVYPEDLALLRRKVGAKYGIDLHDDMPGKEEVLKYFQKYPELLSHASKYHLVAHMGFERATKLITPFMERWNREHGHECYGSGCDCYYGMYHMRRTCRANVIGIEFNKIAPGVTVSEAVDFLRELTKYLQSNG